MSVVKTFLDYKKIGVEQKYKPFILSLILPHKKEKHLVKLMISISNEKVQISLWIIQIYQCFYIHKEVFNNLK